MVKIINIDPNSIAEDLGLQPGDFVKEINGNEITDRLDYRFYVTDESIDLLVQQAGQEIIYEIEKEADDQLGIKLEDMKLKACGNNCVFCFVYQNPKGMRKPLYFKDEDYRFSFMYGHYVTMTTLKEKELKRIVTQRLSPLYISVHATEEKVRRQLLGIRFDDHLLGKIEYLTSNGIELHAQIVLCPGFNDGAVFEKTVDDLSAYYPQLRSVAVVPLGLTRYREGLVEMRMHTAQELRDELQHIQSMRSQLEKQLGDPFVYPADEFFIKAKQDLPPASFYGNFYQIENGVGEFRDMIDSFEKGRKGISSSVKRPLRITWVTGTLAHSLLERFIVEPLRQTKNLSIDLVAVRNEFYGPSIEVSGLLVAQDIYERLKQEELGDLVLLPPRVLNEDGLFLDNWTVDQLQEKLKVPCHVFTEALTELPQVVDGLLPQ